MQSNPIKVSGRIADVFEGQVFPGALLVCDGRVVEISHDESFAGGPFILPGFIDAHVHVESSMLSPGEFARAALVHGVVGAVSDPHEIANVMGLKGVRAMLAAGRQAPFHFAFGAPSCVPATQMETGGACLDSKSMENLFDNDKLAYLSEMMNVWGVLKNDPEVMAKLSAARVRGLPIDGHAPGLRGDELRRYIAAGPTTDHEALTLEEAREKVENSMKILVRRGSAADVLEAFMPLLDERPDACMFCSDDLHPDDLQRGHINQMAQICVKAGIEPMRAIKIACLNPTLHYKLGVGLLQKGDNADFIVVENLQNFNVLQTWVNGRLAAENGACLIPPLPMPELNRFKARPRAVSDFAVRAGAGNLNVIQALDGTLLTERLQMPPTLRNGCAIQDTGRDLLKLAVLNRYDSDTPPALAFVRGFGLKQGALASSIAHDSHHIVAVGASDRALARAINLVVGRRGGLALCSDEKELFLPLPIAGLMANMPCAQIAAKYAELDLQAAGIGCPLRRPFMALSFMALIVIPRLKLSDKGLFDAEHFSFLSLFES